MDPFIGQIMPVGWGFASRGFAACDGQLLPIASNTALFSLLGTTFGGDGRTTFALPDLRGRSMVHVGHGPGLSTITWGERGGRENVTLTLLNLPSHSHLASAETTIYATDNNDAANETGSGDTGLGSGGTMDSIYRENITTASHLGGVTSSVSLANTGNGQSFNIRQPYLGIWVLIALQGIFPSRS